MLLADCSNRINVDFLFYRMATTECIWYQLNYQQRLGSVVIPVNDFFVSDLIDKVLEKERLTIIIPRNVVIISDVTHAMKVTDLLKRVSAITIHL